MKKIGALILALGLVFGFAGCKTSTEELTLKKIEVTNPADKVEYLVGDDLDTTGLEITATYSDESSKVVTGWTTSGYDKTKAGEQTVTVTYTEEGVTAQTSYTVKSIELTKIEITTEPAKKEYFVGAKELDLAGMVVTATYSDGKTADVTKEVTTRGFDSSAATESQTITVTYGGKTATFTVKINPVLVTGIEITNQPTKKEYFVGAAQLDLTGLKVTATYTDGSTADVTANVITNGFNSSTAVESQIITVTYEGKTATFTVKINPVLVTGIEITNQPTKKEYFVGAAQLDLAGLKVTATYNNGTTADVTANVITSGFNSTAAVESQTITVTYEGKTATFTVKITSALVTGIEITNQPTKKEYFVGAAQLDLTGLKVTATYNNGTTADVTDNVITSGFNSSTAVESQTITVTYEGKTATFTVKINPVLLTGIAVTTQPTKKEYFVGAAQLDLTGLKVTATYNNGTTADVTANVITNGFNSSTAVESQIITVTYEGKTATFTVKITSVLVTGIEITNQPTKKEYFVGAAQLDLTGLKVTATYNNGTTADVTANVITTGFNSSTTVESQTITVTYEGKTATFTVKINPVLVTGIEITNQPTKKEYFVGATHLDLTGLKVTATYNNGTTADVTANVITNGFNSNTAVESQTITVTYEGKTATFTVKINPVLLTGIAVTTQPTKKDYHIGDTLDLTGMVVTASYNDGSTKTLASNEYTVTGFDSTDYVNDKEITVTYNEKTDTFKISVLFSWFETPKQLTAGTNGTYGTEGTYVLFGVWPQNVVPEADVAGLALDENAITTIERGYLKYVKGSDDNYYVKHESKWYKVMPIKWRVFDETYDVDGDTGTATGKLLVAENILTANVPYYESTSNRTISNSTVYANNYMHSQIRAYLNGFSYQGKSAEQTQWNNKGFLQTAFTSTAIDSIITTKVDNGEDSTTDVTGDIQKATTYACDPTDDKIFLLSEYEVTKYSKSTEAYNSYGKGNSRIRVTTDFAKANNADQSTTNGYGGYWRLRSPYYDSSLNARYVYYEGDARYYSLVNYTTYGVVPALAISF